MPTLVKICGLSTPDTLDAALDAGADAVGFVFFPPSPRNISFDQARALSARVKASSTRSSPTCSSCTATRRRSASRLCARASACR
jgi:phosphoribosylanthranilate isomerase